MAEVLAAAGSAAAILQLTEYSKKFFKFLKECQAKSTNLPLSFQTILSQQHLLIRSLEILEAHAQQNEVDDDMIPHVQTLSDACYKEFQYLDDVLNSIAASGRSSRAKRAVRAIRHEKDIQRSAGVLRDCFNTLLTVYQIHSIPLGKSPTKVNTTDNNDAESFVTVDEPAEAEAEVHTPLILQSKEEQHVLQNMSLVGDRCNCRRREVVQSATSWTLGSASISSEILTHHRRGCPFHARCIKHNRLTFNLKYTNVMLRIIAGVTMSMTFGAGGLSLSPNLTLRGMKRKDSPAFRLFCDEQWWRYYTVAEATSVVDRISLRLQQMFDERVASPFDLDQEGHSLVWAAKGLLFYCDVPWPCKAFTEKRIRLLTLLRSSGVPLNEFPTWTRVPVTSYFKETQDDLSPTILAFLMVQTRQSPPNHHCAALLCGRKFPEYAEVMDCNTLQIAILQRVKSQVEDTLRANPSAVHFQNTFGQSALHLAADWAWATAFLLKSGANAYQVDNKKCTAIDYAFELKDYEVAKILLEAGSPLPAHVAPSDFVAYYTSDYCEQLFKLLVSHLVIRRRELLHIARMMLSKATLSSIVPPNEAIPDSSSYQLIEAVCAAGHTTKPEYWFHSRQGLYQAQCLCPAAADVLYEAGFTYLEGVDALNDTPLTCSRTSAMVIWLYRKGVSLTRRMTLGDYDNYPALSVPSIYWATLGVAWSIFTDKAHYLHGCQPYLKAHYLRGLSLQQLRKDDIEALNIILHIDFSEWRDSCHCPCCSEGCTPQVIILKTIAVLLEERCWTSRRWPSKHPLPMFLQLVDKITVGLNNRCAPLSLLRIRQAAIRMALVSDLGLRHLCCEVDADQAIRPRLCQEEADEIREEDRFLTQRFGALLPKAQSEWKESSKGLEGFWRDFHRANICRQRERPLSNSELAELRGLGVSVYEASEEDIQCNSLYGDEEGYCESLHGDD